MIRGDAIVRNASLMRLHENLIDFLLVSVLVLRLERRHRAILNGLYGGLIDGELLLGRVGRARLKGAGGLDVGLDELLGFGFTIF